MIVFYRLTICSAFCPFKIIMEK